MKPHQAKIGQEVYTWDSDDGKIVYGTITDIPQGQECIWVKWEDLSEPCKHEYNELDKITIKK